MKFTKKETFFLAKYKYCMFLAMKGISDPRKQSLLNKNKIEI